jgi:reactive chlorine resistance protein C
MNSVSSRKALQEDELIATDPLTRLSMWVSERNLPFLVTSIGMIVMLLWAGAFKMTKPGAEGIIPLVSNSPLTWWHFKVFGPYVGADIIGATEWAAALLFLIGYIRPKAGLIGALITTLMFFTTSSMLLSTPDVTIAWKGFRYMNNLGLFLFKDIISFGVSLYFISYYGQKAMLAKNSTKR